MHHYRTQLPVQEAGHRILEHVGSIGVSVECVDQFFVQSPGGPSVLSLIFEKYYMRNSGRTSLTVTVTDLAGVTDVRAVGAGGADGGLLRFDWGSAGEFEEEVGLALRGTLLSY